MKICRLPGCGATRVGNGGGRRAGRLPGAEALVGERAQHRGRDVADHDEHGVVGPVVAAVERAQLVDAERLQRRLGAAGGGAVAVLRAEEQAREGDAGQRRRIVAGLQQRGQPLGPQPVELLLREVGRERHRRRAGRARRAASPPAWTSAPPTRRRTRRWTAARPGTRPRRPARARPCRRRLRRASPRSCSRRRTGPARRHRRPTAPPGSPAPAAPRGSRAATAAGRWPRVRLLHRRQLQRRRRAERRRLGAIRRLLRGRRQLAQSCDAQHR